MANDIDLAIDQLARINGNSLTNRRGQSARHVIVAMGSSPDRHVECAVAVAPASCQIFGSSEAEASVIVLCST